MLGRKIFALGMKSGRITDSAITASSEYNTYTRAAHGRLNKNFSWRPKEDEHSWIQVDLSYPNNIVGIGTQGGYGNHKDGWVTSYVVGCGENNVTINNISAQNDSEIRFV
ncbi:neuropilin-1-like [Strongylocentrotus purpuratus]|uniref:F5/8 type C domain-containing protein n=1 Tax=Strongylocentrotus purpuratus TaxID=7668 RepID=A0A7M7NW87_STRPU|nr:neuropilin-1-like [Strongylocentrotus purpuratus]